MTEDEVIDRLIERIDAALQDRKPDPCQAKRCSYYLHYLPQGRPELDHEAYHAAEAKTLELQGQCIRWHNDHPEGDDCPFCAAADFGELRIRV